jgi:tetratricopeptide (TPR) repeat protein
VAPLIAPPVMAPILRVVPDLYAEIAAEVSAAEVHLEGGRYAAAAAALSELHGLTPDNPELSFRALVAESTARLYLGELDSSLELVERARALSERPEFGDLHRADAMFRLGCVRLKMANVSVAVESFTLALELCDRSGEMCDRLRADVLQWRSRGYQLRRAWDSARADVERALELSVTSNDEHTTAHVLFQASLIAERTKQNTLACYYGEQAIEIYERVGDRANYGRLLNNLGGLKFLAGKTDEAVALLKQAVAVALEVNGTADAAQAISSLAQVHLRTGELVFAEEQARYALELLDGRVDFTEEIGNAQLVLGRTLAERGEFDEAAVALDDAGATYELLWSASHRAAVGVAKGDLARKRGDCELAADLFRASAELLQDFHF